MIRRIWQLIIHLRKSIDNVCSIYSVILRYKTQSYHIKNDVHIEFNKVKKLCHNCNNR